MTWTDAELETLTEMVKAGKTATQIAAALRPKSRNAVLGKIHRGQGRFGKLAAASVGHGRRDQKVPAKPKRRRRIGNRFAKDASAAIQPPLVADPPPVPVAAPPPIVPNLPATLPIPFLDAVTRDRCLHFIGVPYSKDGPAMPVCGAERVALFNARYCRRHFESQYRAVAA